MALVPTDLFIQAGPLPATFVGTPQDLFVAMVQRMKIMSPGGTNFIFVGDTAPTSNVGPWLRGEQWWVWDPGTKQYVPLDISASFTIPFFIGDSRPSGSVPPVWLKTTQDPTQSAPTAYGNPIAWYFFNGNDWVPYLGVVSSGPTVARPATPDDFQQYYDTDITCLIWWERQQWRTVSGVPGDLKFVAYTTLADALKFNPGWDLFGRQAPGYLGRTLAMATGDATGSGGNQNFSPVAGVPQHNAYDTYGEGSQIQTATASGLVYPPTMALWALIKG